MAVDVRIRSTSKISNGGSGRGRSFGGCSTCRSRHIKCDEAQPTCLVCLSTGLICGGYKRNIFFDFEEDLGSNTGRYRRPIFNERERQAMSDALLASVAPGTTLRQIREIDELCEGSSQPITQQIIRGPFSAFNSVATQDRAILTLQSNHTGHRGSAVSIEGQDSHQVDFVGNASTWSFDTDGLIEDLFESMDHPFSSTLLDSLNTRVVSNRNSGLLDDSLSLEIEPGTCNTPGNIVDGDIAFLEGIPDSPSLDHVIPPQPFQIVQNSVPADAVFLLKHYSSTVLKLLTPFFSQRKTPWHILFIPHIKACLAALALGEEVEAASLCAFYGTWAISALSLGGLTHSPKWLEQGRLYHKQTKDQIELTLKTAYQTQKTAKYKSILMALLTIVQLSMITGNHDQTECYLLETEKFIRMKGLNRKKSRKVRLLHHCYAYERIIHESLFTNSKNSLHRQHVRKAIESSGAVSYSADTLSFRLGRLNNLEEDMLRIKGHEESENDLHLQIPGAWSQSLYPEIFGVPEPYLLLLSLVIRLKREKDHADRGEPDAITLQEFTRWAKSLETCIKHVKESTAVFFGQLQPETPRYVLDIMLDAMQYALAIYFYRQIYELDSCLLQSKVTAVRDCLLRYESIHPDEVYGTARLIWPAFVAACEAEDLETQTAFTQWFELAGKRSGLRLFDEALDKVKLHREKKRHLEMADNSYHDFAQVDFDHAFVSHS